MILDIHFDEFIINLIFYCFEMSKVYISDLDTPLGYHLVDLLRTDHHNPNSPTLIVGSSSLEPVSPIYQTVNFSLHPQLSCRVILDCDLVILNLDSESHEAEVVIKFLQKSCSSLTKPLRVIGLSSLMTWEGLKAYESDEKEADKERQMSAILDETSWKRIVWSESHYQRRIPNNFYIKTHELEKMLLRLNKSPKINATVVATGLLYGRENLSLRDLILNALSGESLDVIGAGDNCIPLTHYETLMDSIQFLIGKEKTPYAIVCDSTQYTQKQLKQLLNEVCENSSPLASKECLYLSKNECDWSINLTLQSVLEIKTIANRRNFETYAKESLLSDFCDYNCYEPKQFFVVIDKYEETDLKELTESQQRKNNLVLQEDIDRVDQQIITKMTPVEPEVPAKKLSKNSVLKPNTVTLEKESVHYYRQALETLLKSRKHHNFIVICRENVVPHMDKQLFFNKMVEILPSEPEEGPTEDQIIFRSEEYYTQLNLPKPEAVIAPLDENTSQNLNQDNEKYQTQASVRKDEQLILLNQYLLDNVLLPISQAKFVMKAQRKEPTLRNFISELKEILARTNNRSHSSQQSD